MVRRVKAISILMIVVILVASFSAISVVQAKTVNVVGDVRVTDEGKVDNCTIKWGKVSGADGYIVYNYNDESKQYDKLKTVKSGKTRKVTLSSLNPSTIYKLKVCAFKQFNGEYYYGEMSPSISAYTCPGKVAITLQSNIAGSLTVNWGVMPGCSGYEIQYSKSSDLNSTDVFTQTVNDGSAATYTIESLEVGTPYFARARALIKVTNKKGEKESVYGEWSDVQTITITDKAVSNVDASKPMVALTFDDGPAYNGATGKILDVLEKYNAHATFYMVGERVNNNTTKYLKREIKLGCELGNHTYNHAHYGSKVTASDISKCSNAIFKAVGQYPTAFRCPGGSITSTIRKECKKEGMPLGYWSVDTEDWKSKNKDKIIAKVQSQTYDGSIILMHDIYTTTADAVEVAVPWLVEQGYQIVTVSELIQAKTGQPAKAGQQYVDYKTINNDTQ